MNLHRAVKAYRWNSLIEAPDFAALLGIPTRTYNRFEAGEDIPADALLAIIRWVFSGQEDAASVSSSEETDAR